MLHHIFMILKTLSGSFSVFINNPALHTGLLIKTPSGFLTGIYHTELIKLADNYISKTSVRRPTITLQFFDNHG
jgi:hypothetical protein